jgi:hypothetical protein
METAAAELTLKNLEEKRKNNKLKDTFDQQSQLQVTSMILKLDYFL